MPNTPRTIAETPFEKSLDQHLQDIRKKIIKRAESLPTEGEAVDFSHIAQAIAEYAPVGEIPKAEPVKGFRFFLSLFPPFILLSFILTVVFGVLGLWVTLGSESPKQSPIGPGFLDIAKIFAGAMVGSASANITSSLKRGKN
jgi:hypothetical protein